MSCQKQFVHLFQPVKHCTRVRGPVGGVKNAPLEKESVPVCTGSGQGGQFFDAVRSSGA
jgi:hypothetical protein